MKNIFTNTSVNADEWLCTKQVARFTKLSTSFFEKARMPLRTDGPSWHKVGGRVRYRLSDVQAWLESCRVTGGQTND